MNDLNGLGWSSKQSNGQKPANYSSFNTLRPTPPGSGRVSPLPTSSPLNTGSKPATPANDSFSNLVSFAGTGANKNLSLQEQQKRLGDLQAQKQNGGTSQNIYAGADENFWNNLGGSRSASAASEKVSSNQKSARSDEDDLFAVFNAPDRNVPVRTKAAPSTTSVPDEDDDPFGLSEFQAKASRKKVEQKSRATQEQVSLDDDDVLGLLGRPVSEFPPPREDSPKPDISERHPQDKAVAELVDMGFPADKARQALESTESGLDVQAAVGWLLNQAHSEAKERSRNVSGDRNGTDQRPTRSRQPQEDRQPRREKASTPSNDAAQVAGEFSASFMKTAGSLWKTGQKKFQQAVQEFNSDNESSQPKWMREASPASRPQRKTDVQSDAVHRRADPSKTTNDDSVTNEALMLESQRPEKPPRPSRKLPTEAISDSSRTASRDHSPAFPSRLRDDSPAQAPLTRSRPQAPPPRANLSRQAAEDQASQAYVSSARRRKPAQASASATSESDLLEKASRDYPASRPAATPNVPLRSQASPRPAQTTPVQIRPAAPPRNIPSVPSISLKASHVDREAGNEHFKRGDYSSAHQSYSKSLTHLPSSHPITIILLTNRALTAIKIGEPKVAVTDSDAAIALIGPSKGDSETINLSDGDSPKPMRDYYGKALMRKAEALEHMEKWSEATLVWREAVESGHGGSTAIQGRQRAENAAKSKQSTVVAAVKKPAPARPAPAKSAAVARAGARAEKAAIDKLRAQNLAAEKLDDERFQLSDAVDAKINGWKGGKQDNLRALLASLDTVLWPEAAWKKISMADLILPNKVKIQYMKGIAKVHPDKIPTSATTEQRMIAGAVFSTLNEAWDKFKKENNL